MTVPRALSRRGPWPWLLMLAIAVAGVVIAGVRDGGATSNQQRIASLAKQIKCPVCNGETIFESQSPTAVNLRAELARQVEAGKSDAEVKAFFAGAYEDILLTTPGTGAGSVVWALPVFALVLAVGGLVLAFRRWKVRPAVATVSDADRALVEAALAEMAATSARPSDE